MSGNSQESPETRKRSVICGDTRLAFVQAALLRHRMLHRKVLLCVRWWSCRRGSSLERLSPKRVLYRTPLTQQGQRVRMTITDRVDRRGRQQTRPGSDEIDHAAENSIDQESFESWRLLEAQRALQRVRENLRYSTSGAADEYAATNGSTTQFQRSAIVQSREQGYATQNARVKPDEWSYETIVKSAAPAVRYDPVRLREIYVRQPLLVRTRQARIAAPLFLFIGRILLDIQMGREQERRRLRAAEFLQIFSNLGPAFIKAGQALASRPDLLPPEYLDEMQKLQDRLPPFSNEDAYRIIEEELQAPVDKIFSRIEPVPVAAASIGQVYKAYLRDGNDTPVAVKVQRPNCENIISLDIHILRELSGVLSRVLTFLRRDINLVSIIDELGKLIFEEIDYLNEARNAERFRELYGALPNVMVPTIYWKYTRRRVITLSWVDGVRLNSPYLDDVQAQKLVEIMVQCSLRQMLENGFFHADPHGGNLLATSDGKLCWLDFGMVSEVEPAQRYGIIEAVMHMVNRDFESLARLYVRLGFIPPDTDLAPLVAALNRALPDVLDASVSELNFKSVINKLGSVMYKFPFRLPPYYTAIIRCLGVLEGLAIQVRRDFKIINNAYPYIASRLLTDPAPELQNALSVLLFKDGRVRWSRLESLLDSASLTSEYDFSIVANQLIEFILSPRGETIRRNLADDLVDELDQLVLDTTKYGLQLIQGKQPVPTKSMVYFQKALSLVVANSAMARSIRGVSETATIQSLILPYIMDGRKFLPVLQLVSTKREGQRLLMEIMTSLAERATLRGIRALFGIEQEGSAPLR
ncbi:hypothetical protein F1559_003682 [Cyanidiococcus yangmingshanensis]|uniref:Protein kinase domain-containing protein n=1 Tax=Cyanidiococcus yangmingshanensis TaxID=2690220 RepID=A0A7J7IKI1_9RHOD|nr:hypothetical protein F1559_003682 [Cyanidiococcus yangmingshanensis]